MIRNLIYSLFFHWLIIILIYANWNSYEYEESDNQSKVTVNFLVKNNNISAPLPQIEKPKFEEQPLKKLQSEAQPPKLEPVKPKPIKPKTPPVKKVVEVKDQPKKPITKPLNKNNKTPKITPPDLKAPAVKKLAEKKEQNKDQLSEIIEKIEEEETIETQNNNNKNNKLSADATKTAQLLETDGLSTREKLNIELQIKRCYKKIIDESQNQFNLTAVFVLVDVNIFISKDGTIKMDEVQIANIYKYDDPGEINFRQAVDNIKRALVFCSPLRNLPEEKYEIWRELHLKFN